MIRAAVSMLAALVLLACVPAVGGSGCLYYYPTRTYYTPTYYSYYPTLPTYTYYTPTYYTPTYTPTYTAPAKTYAAPAAKDWKTQLLELARERDKVEGQLRLNTAEWEAFQQALKTMGLEGNFRQPFYGLGGYSSYSGRGYANHNANLGTYGSNGQTQYGYTYSSIRDLYGDNNMDTRFQEANRLASNAQTLAGQAVQQFQQTVAQEGGNRSRVAEILAQGQIASEAIRAARPYPQSQTTITQQGNVVQGQLGAGSDAQGPPAPTMPRANGNGGQAELSIIPFETVAQKCINCHGARKQEGGFNILNYQGMSAKEKAERVWPRLTHPDREKRMPKGGPPLSPDEVVSIILGQSQSSGGQR